MKTYRIFLHIDDVDDVDDLKFSRWTHPYFRPIAQCVSVDARWYEFYDPREADACLAALASGRTITKARHRAELIDGVKDALLRKAEKDVPDGMIDVWWPFGSLVHLVFPDGKGRPVGYYGRAHGPKGMPALLHHLVIQEMTRLTLDQMCAGDLFQLASLAEIG